MRRRSSLWPRSFAPGRRRVLADRGWRDDALQPQIDRNGPVHLIAMNNQAGDRHSACPLVGPDLHQLHHALVGHGIDQRIAKGRGLLEERDQHSLRAGRLLLFRSLWTRAALEERTEAELAQRDVCDELAERTRLRCRLEGI